jgi:hypothetical protein
MIELRNPERILVISETPQGTVVKESLTDTQPEAKLVLQAALGISGRTSYLVAEQNLVVDGRRGALDSLCPVSRVTFAQIGQEI